jgi:DNA-binding transcriptional LysR family regulator
LLASAVAPNNKTNLARADMKPMELRHLRYFVAVAEERNFTRAAERLGINQRPLSLQIRQLEKEMGTPLFRRQPRGVELTNAGKLMLEEARVILKQVEQAALISLAHRRDDRSAVVQNFVAVARRATRAAQHGSASPKPRQRKA